MIITLKIRKVIVERKRRERIDRCLDQLKDILLSNNAHNDENSCVTGSLEKADILELTLRHVVDLRNRVRLQRCAGWLACLKEIDSYLRKSPFCSGSLRQKLFQHLQMKQYDFSGEQWKTDVENSCGRFDRPMRHPLTEQPINMNRIVFPVSACIQPVEVTFTRPFHHYNSNSYLEKDSRSNESTSKISPMSTAASASLRQLSSNRSSTNEDFPSRISKTPSILSPVHSRNSFLSSTLSNDVTPFPYCDREKFASGFPDSEMENSSPGEDDEESIDVDVVNDVTDDKNRIESNRDATWRPW